MARCGCAPTREGAGEVHQDTGKAVARLAISVFVLMIDSYLSVFGGMFDRTSMHTKARSTLLKLAKISKLNFN